MSQIEFIEAIRNFIAQSEIKKAIDLMQQYGSEHKDELAIHASRLSYLEKMMRLDTITLDESRRERNKICVALLELANEIEIKSVAVKKLHFSSELQEILALAEMQSRRDGEEVTGTREFFRALVTLRPTTLLSVITEIEQEQALPNPIDSVLLDLPRLLSPNRPLSSCLTNSTNALIPIVSDSSPIQASEMFVDVAKFGKGKSVKKLREHNITPQTIDDYVEKYSIDVRKRVEI